MAVAPEQRLLGVAGQQRFAQRALGLALVAVRVPGHEARCPLCEQMLLPVRTGVVLGRGWRFIVAVACVDAPDARMIQPLCQAETDLVGLPRAERCITADVSLVTVVDA